jgi:hypothetical protein
MGAANRELVKGLLDAKLYESTSGYISREMLGDYGNLTPREQVWRSGLIPFYSWMKINAPGWYRMVENAVKEGQGGALGRASAMATAKGLALVVGAASAIRVYNETVHGDIEEKLPLNVRRGTHIILKDGDGKAHVMTVSDAMDDLFTMAGLDNAVPEAFSIMRGTLTPSEYWARRQKEGLFGGVLPGKGLAKQTILSLGPPAQVVGQLLAKKRFFPDPFNPVDIPEEQMPTAWRDVLGVSALWPDRALSGALDDYVAQPTPFPLSPSGVTRALGIRQYNTPSILMDGGATQYESDLIKQLQRVDAEIRAMKGRAGREKAGLSNRQLDDATRDANFDARLNIITESKVEELRRLSQRLADLQRSRRQ